MTLPPKVLAALSDASSFVYRSLSTSSSSSSSSSSTADSREGTSTYTTVLDIATTALRLKNVLGVDLSSWKKPAPIPLASGRGKSGKPMKKNKPQPVKRVKPQPVKKGAKRVPRGGGGSGGGGGGGSGGRSSSSTTDGPKKKSEGGGGIVTDAISLSLGELTLFPYISQ